MAFTQKINQHWGLCSSSLSLFEFSKNNHLLQCVVLGSEYSTPFSATGPVIIPHCFHSLVEEGVIYFLWRPDKFPLLLFVISVGWKRLALLFFFLTNVLPASDNSLNDLTTTYITLVVCTLVALHVNVPLWRLHSFGLFSCFIYKTAWPKGEAQWPSTCSSTI